VLAFDRDRLRHLTNAVSRAVDDLARWSTADVAVDEARHDLRSAHAVLEPWIARLTDLAASDVMDRHPSLALTTGTRTGIEARALSHLVGWAVVRDGLDRRLLDDRELTSLLRRLDRTHLGQIVIDALADDDPDAVGVAVAALPVIDGPDGGATRRFLMSLPDDTRGPLAVLLGTTPAAARAVLAALDELDRGLAALFMSTADPMAVMSMITLALSDRSVVESGPIVLSVTRAAVSVTASDPGTYGRLLGELVTPYLLQFTSRAGDWGIPPRDGADLLGLVLRDDGAMHQMLESRTAWSAVATVPIDRDGLSHLDDIAGLYGWLDAIIHREEVHDALATRRLWDLAWVVVDLSVDVAIKATGLAGPGQLVAGAVIDRVLPRVKREMEERGVLGAPDTREQVAVDARRRHDWRRTMLGAVTATATVEVLRATQGVRISDPPPAPTGPSDACSSVEWLDDFDRWSTTIDRRSRRVVHHAVRTVLNRYQAAEACYDID
jgi:hypothetical protein